MVSTFVNPINTRPQTQKIILQGVSWSTYGQLLAELGDQRSARLAYNRGTLEITMPSEQHETFKKLLERMIETLTEVLDLPAKAFGSTTLNRDDLQRGGEPDSCYYIQNVAALQGRQINLTTDPPPDLVLEIDISSSSRHRIPIYQALGVPEIWQYSGGKVVFLHLQGGEYTACDTSLAFPQVSSQVVNDFLQQAQSLDDTRLLRSWRQWITNHC